ncbi:MAG: LysE family translocator [Pseudomonadota bacterium]
MPITNFTLFLSITFIVSASPGPVMLSCMSNGGRYGISKALEGMLGASLGNLLLVGLSALGLGLIVNNNDFLFNALKWLGALYLMILGIQLMRQPVAACDIDNNNPTNKNPSLWLNSFIIAVSNPKGLIYFGALFPQFITYHQPLIIQFILLTLTFLITDFVWMLAYAAAGQKIMGWLKKSTHQTLFNIASGAILIAAGLFMALTGKS